MQYNLGNEESENLFDLCKSDSDFEFPSNIKQMGSIDKGIKIYMEDYVYTYLYQYAKSKGNKEKLAVLVGKHTCIDKETVIIISGAIQAKGTVMNKGAESFTQESWNYISSQMELYFKDLSVLGWMHAQPNFGGSLLARDERFHRDSFNKPWQVLYVLDTIENVDSFFVHNSEKTSMRPAKGYFIYYDKNDSMQEYMLNNSLVKPKISLEEKNEIEIELNQIKDNIDEKNFDKSKLSEKAQKYMKGQFENPEEIPDAAVKIRRKLNSREKKDPVKNRFNLLAGISAMLCVAILFMGARLISTQNRINILENEFGLVKTSYNDISKMLSDGKTQSVFASQPEEIQAPKEETAANETKGIIPAEQPKTEIPAESVSNEQPKTEIPTESVPTEQPKTEIPAEPVPNEQPKTEVPAEPVPTEQPKTEIPALPSSNEIPEYYIIEDGDNLGYVSVRFYGTSSMVQEIMDFNDISDADLIIIGEKIYLPPLD